MDGSFFFGFILGNVFCIFALISGFYFFLLKKIESNRKAIREVQSEVSPALKHTTTGELLPNIALNKSQSGMEKSTNTLTNLAAGATNSSTTTNANSTVSGSFHSSLLNISNSSVPNDPRSGLTRSPSFSGSGNNSLRSSAMEVDSKKMPDTPKKKEKEKIVQLPEDTIKSGWLKVRGSLNVWWNRWCVLRPGKLVYYRSENKEDCFGIVLLQGCEIKQRESKKSGFCFKLSNLQGKSIYSTRGLKGEALTSAKMPGNISECIMRCQTETEGKEWMDSITRASAFAADLPFVEDTLSTTLRNSNKKYLDIPSQDSDKMESDDEESSSAWDEPEKEQESIPSSSISNSLSSSSASANKETSSTKRDSKEIKEKEKEMNVTNTNTKELLNSSGKREKKSKREKEKEKERDRDPDRDVVLQSTNTSTNSTNIKEKEKEIKENILMRESSKDSLPTYIGVNDALRDSSSTTNPPPFLVISEIDQNQTISETQIPPPLSKQASTRTLTLSPNMNAVETEVLKEETLQHDMRKSSEKTTKEPTYREGWLQLKLPQKKDFSFLYFFTKGGLLMYFENEKTNDCDGIIDLTGCQVSLDGEKFDVFHPDQKPILLMVGSSASNDKTAKQKENKVSELSRLQFKSESAQEASLWVQTIRDILADDQNTDFLWIPLKELEKGREEKCHWFNFFMDRYFEDFRNSEIVNFLFKGTFARRFEKIKRPDYIGPIVVEKLDFGNKAPYIKEIAVLPTHRKNELTGEALIEYSGGAKITITTEFYVNFPYFKFATIPIIASVKVESLKGKIFLHGPPEAGSRLSISFDKLPQLQFKVKMRVGGKYKYDLSKFSKISEFIVTVIEKVFWKNAVHPNCISIALPIPGRKLQPKTTNWTSKSRRVDTNTTQEEEINVNPASIDRPQTPKVNVTNEKPTVGLTPDLRSAPVSRVPSMSTPVGST